MVIRDILNVLKQDAQLCDILQPIEHDSKIYMYGATQLGTSIIYKLDKLVSDGVISQYRLEINSISKDYMIANEISSIVQRLLLTVGDNCMETFEILDGAVLLDGKHKLYKEQSGEMLNISLNGGGSLFNRDTKLHTIKTIYSIKNKERMLI